MSKILYTDLMEFSTDELAQASWITDADTGLPSAEYSVGDGIDSYTKLLLHANGGDATTRFIDNANDDQDGNNCVLMLHFDGADTATTTIDAATNKAVTFVGTAQLDTAEKKFGTASLLLDGNSDYITLADSADWDFGAGDFTIDFWFRFNADSACVICDNGAWVYSTGFNVEIANDLIYVWLNANSYSFTFAPSEATWYHIAVSRNGTDLKAFVDGTQVGETATSSDDITSAYTLTIGSLTDSYRLNGWLDDFRIVKGTALWTANFTAPTVSPSPKLVTAVADAQIDTAQKVFGTGSVLFDGTGDYLSIPDSPDWDFGTGDFTIDCWIRVVSGTANFMICGHGRDYYDNGSYNFWYDRPHRRFAFTAKAQDGTFSRFNYRFEPAADTWYHIALVRKDNYLNLYHDGIIDSTTDLSCDIDLTFSGDAIFTVGAGAYTGLVATPAGWIDELRISKGIARWTSNFNTLNLQCYSEDTIKEQGSYSLKIESNTDSLNDTLTKTLTDYLDYSVMDVIKFSVRASRTGSNIKLKIHDTGGTTSEHTINIASADTWQTEIFDISAIATADRDTIDKIIIEIINADVANTIYVDNLFSKAVVESSHTWVG